MFRVDGGTRDTRKRDVLVDGLKYDLCSSAHRSFFPPFPLCLRALFIIHSRGRSKRKTNEVNGVSKWIYVAIRNERFETATYSLIPDKMHSDKMVYKVFTFTHF